MRIALIAHDETKARMIEFAIDHEAELAKFGTILATGTTGREVAAATTKRIDKRMIRLREFMSRVVREHDEVRLYK